MAVQAGRSRTNAVSNGGDRKRSAAAHAAPVGAYLEVVRRTTPVAGGRDVVRIAPDKLEGLECDFVRHAKAYGNAMGVAYSAWREVGVPSWVLRDAGITRSARRTKKLPVDQPDRRGEG